MLKRGRLLQRLVLLTETHSAAFSEQMIFIAVFPFTCISVIAYIIIALILILKTLIRHIGI